MPPIGGMERRLSCRRLGGWSGDFLVADWGEEGTGSPPCTVRSRRQESCHSRWASGATRKSPLPVGDKKVPSGRQESRHSQRATSPLPGATRKSPLPVGDRQGTRKSPLPDKKVATPSGRQESQWATRKRATGKSPLPVGDRKVATPSGRQESRHSYSSSRCGGPSQTSSGWAFHHSSRACSWGARHPS